MGSVYTGAREQKKTTKDEGEESSHEGETEEKQFDELPYFGGEVVEEFAQGGIVAGHEDVQGGRCHSEE